MYMMCMEDYMYIMENVYMVTFLRMCVKKLHCCFTSQVMYLRLGLKYCTVHSSVFQFGNHNQCTIPRVIDFLEYSKEDIYTIAEYDFNWRRVGRRLIGDRKVQDIDCEGDNEGEKREKMLLEWKRTKSHKATYQALVKGLRAIENNATADQVEELERKSKR